MKFYKLFNFELLPVDHIYDLNFVFFIIFYKLFFLDENFEIIYLTIHLLLIDCYLSILLLTRFIFKKPKFIQLKIKINIMI